MPVSPVDRVLKNSESEGVWQPFTDNFSAVAPVEKSGFDDVVFSIRPVNPIGCIVQGETVRPKDRFVDDALSVAAIHFSSFDFGVRAPIGPKDEGFTWVDRDSARFINVVPGNDGSLFAIQSCHFDASGAGIRPED